MPKDSKGTIVDLQDDEKFKILQTCYESHCVDTLGDLLILAHIPHLFIMHYWQASC